MTKLYKSAVAAVVVGLTQFRGASATLNKEQIRGLQPNVTRLSFDCTRGRNGRKEGVLFGIVAGYSLDVIGQVKEDNGTLHSLYWSQSDVRLVDGSQCPSAPVQPPAACQNGSVHGLRSGRGERPEARYCLACGREVKSKGGVALCNEHIGAELQQGQMGARVAATCSLRSGGAQPLSQAPRGVSSEGATKEVEAPAPRATEAGAAAQRATGDGPAAPSRAPSAPELSFPVVIPSSQNAKWSTLEGPATLIFQDKNCLSFVGCKIQTKTEEFDFPKEDVEHIEFVRQDLPCCLNYCLNADVVQTNFLSKFFELCLFPVTRWRLASSGSSTGGGEAEVEKAPSKCKENFGKAALVVAVLLLVGMYGYQKWKWYGPEKERKDGSDDSLVASGNLEKKFKSIDMIVVMVVGYLIVSLYISEKMKRLVNANGAFEQLPRFGSTIALFFGLIGKALRFLGNMSMASFLNLGEDQQEDFLFGFLVGEASILYATRTANIFMAWYGLDFEPKTLGSALGHLTGIVLDISFKTVVSLSVSALYTQSCNRDGGCISFRKSMWSPIRTLSYFTGWMTAIFYVSTHGVLDIYQNSLVLNTPDLVRDWRSFFAQQVDDGVADGSAAGVAAGVLRGSAPASLKSSSSSWPGEFCIATKLAKNKWDEKKYGDKATFYSTPKGWSSPDFGKGWDFSQKIAASFENAFSTGVFVRALAPAPTAWCNNSSNEEKMGALMLLVRSKVLEVHFTTLETLVLSFLALVVFGGGCWYLLFKKQPFYDHWPSFLQSIPKKSDSNSDTQIGWSWDLLWT